MQRHYKGSGAWRRWAAALLAAASAAGAQEAPAPGQSPRVDAIRKAGELRVGVLQNAPWLIQDVSGKSGEAWSGPAWLLAREYARRLGVKLTPVPVSHETKVPVLAANQVDMTISPLAETPERLKVVDFVLYSATSVCMFGRAGNDKLAQVRSVDDLNRPGITIAYFTGGAEEAWVKQRFQCHAARRRQFRRHRADRGNHGAPRRRRAHQPRALGRSEAQGARIAGVSRRGQLPAEHREGFAGGASRRQGAGRLPCLAAAGCGFDEAQLDADETRVIEQLP